MAGSSGWIAPIDRSLNLPADPSSAATARRFVANVLEEWQVPGLVDTVTLLVSELVTNAVLHARTECELVLRLRDRVLRVEVHDRSPVAPSRRLYEADAGTGRGMLLIEALASAWGADAGDAGKQVWFEVDGEDLGIDLGEADAAVTAERSSRADTRGPGGPAGHGPAPRRRDARLTTPFRPAGARR